MCGRFTLTTPGEVVAELLGADEPIEIAPRYNIAPTQLVAAVRAEAGARRREMTLLRWGLVPYWAKDPTIGNRLINARAETIAEKPSFRDAFQRRRCLIPADGFFEWKRSGSTKQPILVRAREGAPFAFAGLWESWHSGKDDAVESCTIITTTPNALMETIHDRMPVILAPEDYAGWLDPDRDPKELTMLLRPYHDDALTAQRVSRHVNDARNDDAECVRPLPDDD